jgi:hypothetical protein
LERKNPGAKRCRGWINLSEQRWVNLTERQRVSSTIHQHFVSRLPSLEQEMGEELFVSGLVGPYRIFQRKNGHRHGIDDATTAWYALQKTPPVKKTLDLGTGIGTVGFAASFSPQVLEVVKRLKFSQRYLKPRCSR